MLIFMPSTRQNVPSASSAQAASPLPEIAASSATAAQAAAKQQRSHRLPGWSTDYKPLGYPHSPRLLASDMMNAQLKRALAHSVR